MTSGLTGTRRVLLASVAPPPRSARLKASLSLPPAVPTFYDSNAFCAYLEDADISDVPDAHALQAFDDVANRLCAKGLAIRHHVANHGQVHVAMRFSEGDEEDAFGFCPGQLLAASSTPTMLDAMAAARDSITRLRFPDTADFFDVIVSYMTRDVPGELWLAGDGPAFDPERDFALLQRLRAVAEAMQRRQAELWAALVDALVQATPAGAGAAGGSSGTEGRDGAVTRAWDRWLWLVEEQSQLQLLLKGDASLRLALTVPRRAVWQDLREVLQRRCEADTLERCSREEEAKGARDDTMVVVTRPAAAAQLGLDGTASGAAAAGAADATAAPADATAAPAAERQPLFACTAEVTVAQGEAPHHT